MRSWGDKFALLLICGCCFPVLFGSVCGQEISVGDKFGKGDFRLVENKKAAKIFVSSEDFKVVNIAAGDFALDVERVTGTKPQIENAAGSLSKNSIIIGTIGKNSLIDELIKQGKLDVSSIQNKRETFLIQTIVNMIPNVENALVIVGADRRGTAFGVYEMSQKIGVSPWVWWADVAPEMRKSLFVSNGKYFSGEPSVKYRGIFLNDEDWGLNPWAAKTFEPETGNIGPKTYAKIFELLLRLKANTCWSAMHEVTKPFNENPLNAKTADDYAIIMGSSHAEPMLRNNVGEWKDAKENYNFVTNEKGVTDYWEERLKTNGKYENIYTLGMRGIHDSPIQGVKTQAERIPVLNKIIQTQRNLLAEYVDPNIEKIPQIFCPYKEVLADYRAGLQVPDDVTIVFPDDNFGYIRYFPNREEQRRTGGFGVYYHISYLGRPLSYLWLETTPPALIWEEMSKAFDHNMRDFWMLNVGDIKPAEIGIELFMQMAWNIKKYRRDNTNDFLKTWAKREFGEKDSREIADIMRQYYALGFQRKPEHLQWYLPTEKPKPSDYSAVSYADEMQKRLDNYEALAKRVDQIYAEISPEKKDAFFELVLYPVRGAWLANKRFFSAEKAEFYNQQHRKSAFDWARNSLKANAEIGRLTVQFGKIGGGKWRGIMSPEMNEGQWTSMRSTPPKVSDLQIEQPQKSALFAVAVEGEAEPVKSAGTLPILDSLTRQSGFIDVFNQGEFDQKWTAMAKQNWIKLSQTTGDLHEDTRISVSIDWKKLPSGKNFTGIIEIKSEQEIRKITVPVLNPKMPKNFNGFVESNGVISMEAEHFTGKTAKNGASWETIQDLGRTGDSVAIFPTTAPSYESQIIAQSPSLEYRFYSFSTGEFDAHCYLIPTQPLQPGKGLRYAIAVDDQPPQIVAVGADAEVSSNQWSLNVLNATATGTAKVRFDKGLHVLKIYAVDAGVILDKIVIDTGGMQNSYLGAPETMNSAAEN